MKLLVTGLRGTLAPKLDQAAGHQGHEVLAWDRSLVNPDDLPAAQAWLNRHRPDAIAHLAMGSVIWAGLLARHAAEKALPMLFTSSAMVFDHLPDGPHAPLDERTAKDDYGRYKMACEDAIAAAHPAATIARIGWQIDPTAVGNNMLMALDDWQRREGRVAASSAWRPACSFMTDTADALLRLLLQPVPGVVHLDSNAAEGHSFDNIVRALQQQFKRCDWRLSVNEDYRHDQRLAGGAEQMPGLSARLPALTSPSS